MASESSVVAETRAAIVDHPGAVPRIGSIVLSDRRPGTTLVRIRAASINPIDKGIAAGMVPGLRHEQPYVPGMECVGEVVSSDSFEPGRLVFGEAHASPTSPGTLADFAALDDASLLPVPDGLDPALAVGVANTGIAAFLPLVDLANVGEGDVVLVLGATGSVGRLAVQIARDRGASHIIAVGRDSASLEVLATLGAATTIELAAGDDADSLAARLSEAPPPTVVLDALYGFGFTAALRVCAPKARVVNIGNALDATAAVPAGILRLRQVTVMGFASVLTPVASKSHALAWIWERLLDGRMRFSVTPRALDEIVEAWTAPYESGVKHVLIP